MKRKPKFSTNLGLPAKRGEVAFADRAAAQLVPNRVIKYNLRTADRTADSVCTWRPYVGGCPSAWDRYPIE